MCCWVVRIRNVCRSARSHEVARKLSELVYEAVFEYLRFGGRLIHLLASWRSYRQSRMHTCAPTRKDLHTRARLDACTQAHTHSQANECVFMGPRTMFLQGPVFVKKSALRKLRHCRLVAPPPSRQSWQHSLRAFQAERKKVPRMHPLPRIGLCQLCLWTGRGWATPFLTFLRGRVQVLACRRACMHA